MVILFSVSDMEPKSKLKRTVTVGDQVLFRMHKFVRGSIAKETDQGVNIS